MLDIGRPNLTLGQWTPAEGDGPRSANYGLMDGTFGPLLPPYTVPSYLWLAAQNAEAAKNGTKLLSRSCPKGDLYSDNAYVVIEKSNGGQDWTMGIEYIYVQPSTPSVKTIAQWLDSVLVRLGLMRHRDQEQWLIAYHSLQDMKYLDCGAQGFVYLAKLNNELVAVKKLRSKCSIADFSHLRQLNHPNLVTFKGASVSAESQCCLVMEYCPHGQLSKFLAGIESLPPIQLADWSRQIASGMAYLHENSIIHRDLKSPNVLIAQDNLLKICDFDTSLQLSSRHSRQMSHAGTVAWMAPEMIRNEKCSEKIDIWSYGVLLWELVSLEMPYRNFETIAIMFGVGNGTLTLPLPTFTPDTAALGQLMQQCWSADPKQRPSFPDILVQLGPIADQMNCIEPSEFQTLQQQWKAHVQLVQSRIRTRSTSSMSNSKASTLWQSTDSSATGSIGSISLANKKRRRSRDWSSGSSKQLRSCGSVGGIMQRKRKRSEAEEETAQSDAVYCNGERVDSLPFNLFKRMKPSPSSMEKSATASKPRPAVPNVDVNLLKYLYYLIVRTCK